MSTPNKYQPKVNMPDRVAADYWQGALTRAEAQKVFDEHGNFISMQAKSIMQLDATIAYMAEKFGINPEDVTNWIQEKAKQAEAPEVVANA